MGVFGCVSEIWLSLSVVKILLYSADPKEIRFVKYIVTHNRSDSGLTFLPFIKCAEMELFLASRRAILAILRVLGVSTVKFSSVGVAMDSNAQVNHK